MFSVPTETHAQHRNPFSISPDPKLFYFSQQHVQCLQSLESALRLRSGLSLVLGDVGTGKTTIGRILVRLFYDKPDYMFRLILDPQFESETEFLGHLSKLFEVRHSAKSLLELKESLQSFLYYKGVNEKKIPVLIIDEGQKLTLPIMEVIRSLLNFETNEFKLIQVVILAQLEFADRIRTMPNFMDRISSSYLLEPFSRDELDRLIDHRLRRTGGPALTDVFTPAALDHIYSHSHGFPRRAMHLCHQAFQSKIGEHLAIIDADVIARNIRKQEVAYV